LFRSNFLLRFFASRKDVMMAPMAIKRRNQYFCIHSDILTTILVKDGKSAPNEEDKSWKTKNTFTIRIIVTISATTTTAAGYFMAFLIFCLSSSLFSL